MKCVILGGGGFIGSNLALALFQRGCEVRIFDHSKRALCGNMLLPQEIEWYQGDFQNKHDLGVALQDSDVVFHLISSTIPQSSNDDPIYDLQSNVVATLQLLDTMRTLNVPRLIFVSSGGTVYGVPDAIPLTEAHPTNPICAYGISKLAIEKYLSLYCHLYALDYTILRLSNPYGAHQDASRGQGAVAAFCNAVKQGIPLQIWGDGSIVRDYIHIDDVCSAMCRVLDYSGSQRIFNIGSGVGTSLNQLVDVLRQVADNPVQVEYHPARKCDVPVNILAIERAERALGWRPLTDLECGISSLL